MPPRIVRRGLTQAGRRGSERGLTLLEMMVTIALIAVTVVGTVYGLAAVENVAATSQNQSQLELAMRQLADFARDSSPNTGLQYTACAQVTTPVTAAAAGSGTYQSQLTTKFPTPPTGVGQWGFTAIYESLLGTGSHDGQATSAKTNCTATTGDWGVQEIKLAVFGGNNKVTRTVWKSDGWCYNPAASPPQC